MRWRDLLTDTIGVGAIALTFYALSLIAYGAGY